MYAVAKRLFAIRLAICEFALGDASPAYNGVRQYQEGKLCVTPQRIVS